MGLDVGSRIRKLRDERKLTLKTLGELSGVTKNYINLIERHLKTPSMDILGKLANGFNISVVELLGRDAYVLENIKLIMGSMTIEEFVEDMRKKTGLDVPDISDVKSYIYLEISPDVAALQLLSYYAGVDIDFFYKHNTPESWESAKLKNKSKDEATPKLDKNFIRLIKKLDEHNIDISALEKIVDIMISQKK